MREKDQQDVFQLNYPPHVSSKQVQRQEVIPVFAAYSISHGSMGV